MTLVADRCPLCQGASTRRFAKGDWWIRDCRECGHRFAEIEDAPGHVERVYADGYFDGGGAGYPGYLAEASLLRRSGRWYARTLSRYMAEGSVLDVGSAAGFWLRGLADGGWSPRGIEPNAAMAEHARTVLGLDVVTGALESVPDDGRRYDLVSMIQVVAHFVDARHALATAAERIRPGGALLVETWDRESWTARRLGRHWHEYSPPSVLHWFSAADLGRAGRALGLVERARGRPRKRISVAHARSLIAKEDSAGLAALASRALGILPARAALPYLADDVFWMLLERP